MILDNELFDRIDKYLDSFDFKRLDPKFKRLSYYVYDNGNIYNRDEEEPFFSSYSNPHIYDGVAIVSLERNDIKELVAELLLRMYRIFLINNYKMIVPNYLNIVSTRHDFLRANYYLYEEKILKKAYRTRDKNIKNALLALFLNVRSLREESKGEGSIDEYKAEQFHGLLVCAEREINRQIYKEEAKQKNMLLMKKLEYNFKEYFCIKNSTCLTGYYLRAVLKQLQYELHHHEIIYYYLVNNMRFIHESVTIPNDAKALKIISKRENMSKEAITTYFLHDPKKYKFDGYISSYDPDSVIKFKDKYYFKNYCVLKDVYNNLTYLQGPCIVKCKEENPEKVESYYVTYDY